MTGTGSARPARDRGADGPALRQRLAELGRVLPPHGGGRWRRSPHHPERVELGGSSQPGVVERAEGMSHLRRGVGRRSSSSVSSWPGTKHVMRQGGVSNAAATRGAMPSSQPLVRDALGLAIDPEQCSVLAGEPHHVVGRRRTDPEVAVGDPTGQCRHGTLPRAEERGHAGHHLGELRDGYLLVHRRAGRPDADAAARSEAMGAAGRLSSLAPRTSRPRPGLPRTSLLAAPGALALARPFGWLVQVAASA